MKAITRGSFIILSMLIEVIVSHPSFAQRLENDTLSTKETGIYPLPIFFYTPETGFAGGGAALYLYRDTTFRESRASDITGDVIYTEKKQVIVEFKGDFYFADGVYRLLADTWFKKFSEQFFWNRQ